MRRKQYRLIGDGFSVFLLHRREGRSCRACFPEPLGQLVLGILGLGARSSCLNRLDQDIGFARHVPHERPCRTNVPAGKTFHFLPLRSIRTRLREGLQEDFQATLVNFDGYGFCYIFTASNNSKKLRCGRHIET